MLEKEPTNGIIKKLAVQIATYREPNRGRQNNEVSHSQNLPVPCLNSIFR
jgi:hypothetical protein